MVDAPLAVGDVVSIDPWDMDCLHWRGRVLIGRYAHYCLEWDGLPIDETCLDEWPCACGMAAKDEPRRCPRCGSFAWVYKGGVMQCADCGR